MAYLDFRPLLPGGDGGTTVRGRASEDPPQRRPVPAARVSWIGGGIAGAIVGLLYALAYVALDEPAIALLVTVLMLLPAASLLGGHGRAR